MARGRRARPAVPFGIVEPRRQEQDDEWLREQIELLADEVRQGPIAFRSDQLHRLLTGIARGVDWRDGAWR